MAEGLSPIEAGKKLHEYGETLSQEAGGPGDAHGGADRHSRIVQIGEAVLLALVTITAAWAGYSAARWGTASRVEIAQSSTLRALATRDDLTALSQRNFDAAATTKFDAGNHAGLVGDDYVRITVFLAAVLFLVGIGSSFKLHGIRYALITFGSVLLILSIVLILRQPGLPS